MKKEKEQTNGTSGLEIAVIGMAGRFPGAKNTTQFWENIKNGMETIAFLSDEQLLAAGVSRELLKNPAYVKTCGGLLEDKDYFDAAFFSYTPREAEIMEVQQRVFHECAWEALEDAGYDPYSYQGAVGVYAGASSSFLWQAAVAAGGRGEELGQFAREHFTNKDFLSSRVSYKLNLKGPSFTMYTACSTSLTAIHLAARSLLTGECRLALAGGVTANSSKPAGYLYQEGMIYSSDGHCRAFDARADGIIGGEGCAVVVLKKLKEAIADRDHIYAVIKGSAVNNDGFRKVGYTAPSLEAQVELVKSAGRIAGIDLETIGYIETHGTGTAVGDPIEVEALKRAFNMAAKKNCALGSVKTNVGHLDSAAGGAGFIKAALALTHRVIPPSLHFETPNPRIDFANSPFYVNTTLRQWQNDRFPLRAGAASFGIGGANAFAILEEWQQNHLAAAISHCANPDYRLFLLSAGSRSALTKASQNLATFLSGHPGVDPADVAYTLQTGRHRFAFRQMLLSPGVDAPAQNAAADLIARLSNPATAGVFSHHARKDNIPLIFMFSGQGSQYVDMGADLYRSQPLFRREIDRGFAALRPLMDRDVKEILYPGLRRAGAAPQDDNAGIDHVLYSGPIKFIFEYSLARLFMSWGVKPAAMIGHSFGEYMAACLAGVFSMEDAVKIAVLRGQAMHRLPPGAMLGVSLSEEEITPLLENNKEISLAAINSSTDCILSGPPGAVERARGELEKKGEDAVLLNFPKAAHSWMVDAILPEFAAGLQQVKFKPPQIPYISGLTGKPVEKGEATDPAYWVRHLRETVRFSDGLSYLLKESEAVFVQVGSDRGLPMFVERHRDRTGRHLTLNLVRHKKENIPDGCYTLLKLGFLWLYGAAVDWPAFYGEEKRYRVSLPTYPFERQYYPIDADLTKIGAGSLPGPAAAAKQENPADWCYVPTWIRCDFSLQKSPPAPAPGCWLLFSDGSSLAAGLEQKLRRQDRQVFVVMLSPGTGFIREAAGVYRIDHGEESHYDALLERLLATGSYPDNIFHLWSMTDSRTNHGSPGQERYAETLARGFTSLFYLARALGRRGVTRAVRLTVATRNTQEVVGRDMLYPEAAAVLGAARVIPLEYPNIECRSIDLVPPQSGSREEDKLQERLLSGGLWLNEKADAGQALAYRGDYSWQQTFRLLRLEKPGETIKNLRRRGVYLITGGLGAIGLALAEYLAKNWQARLILVGRTDFPKDAAGQGQEHDPALHRVSAREEKIRRLEKMGAEVLVLKADVSRQPQMEAVLAQALSRFGAVHGVIHAAGVPDGAVIARRTAALNNSILAAKATGALVLDQVLRDKKIEPDFVVYFSSLNAFLPTYGQLGHCAANAFLDAFAHYQAGRSAFPVISIDWNAWQDIGQAAEAAANLGLESAPVNSLSPAQGVDLFCRILDQALFYPQVAVSSENLAHPDLYKKRAALPAQEKPGSYQPDHQDAPDAKQRPNLSSEYAPPGDKLEQYLAAAWQKFLGFSRIGIHDNFFELGGNSLVGIRLVNHFKKRFGEIVHITVIFEAPTIAESAAYFKKNYPEAAAAVLGLENASEYPAFTVSRIDEQVVSRLRAQVSASPAPWPAQTVKNKPAVFILTPARSGSTLLRVMLAGHPRLFAPPELALLSFPALAEKADQPDSFGLSLQALARAVMQLQACPAAAAQDMIRQWQEQRMTVFEVYRRLQEWLGDRMLVDKSTNYAQDSRILERIEMEFGNPLYIHLLRHPAAVIHSFAAARIDLMLESSLRDKLPYSRQELAELNWLLCHRNILEFLCNVPPERHTRVRFEDLVKDPRSIMEQLCAFLHLDFHPGMVQPYREKEQRMTDGIHPEGLMMGDVKFHEHADIDPAIADNWRQTKAGKEYSPGSAARRLAAEFGYASAGQKQPPGIVPVEEKEYYELPAAQKRIYILHHWHKHNIGYNVPVAWLLAGAIDKRRMQDAFRELIARHEILRTSFLELGEAPVQFIRRSKETTAKVEYYRADKRTAVDIIRDFVRPFDLAQAPLLRIALIEKIPDEFFLVLDIHHIIADGASLNILIKEFMTLYQGEEPPAEKIRCKDFALWQNKLLVSGEIKKQEEYWIARFRGASKERPDDISLDLPRPPVRTFAGGRLRLALGKEATAKLRELASRSGTTLFITALAIYHILLAKYSGREDIVVGLALSGRTGADLENSIGMFVNMLPSKNPAAPEMPFSDFLAAVKENTIRAFENQDYQFDELVRRLGLQGNPNRNPLFDTVFAYQDMRPAEPAQPGALMKPFEYEKKTTHFDLLVYIDETFDDCGLTLEYSTELFKKETAARLAKHYVEILNQAAADFNIDLGAIAISHSLTPATAQIPLEEYVDFDS